MKKYIVTLLVLFIVYLCTLKFYEEQIPNNNEEIIKNENITEQEPLIVKLNYNNNESEIPLDKYVINVLSCEMPALFFEEALKAGAVAIRTFYIYKYNNNNNYVASVIDQCYLSDEELKDKWKDKFDVYYNKISKIVESTKNEIITYNGKVIASFYFSLSNGKTENVQSVFSSNLPYLKSVESIWDKNVNNYLVTIEMDKDKFFELLNIEGNNLDIEVLSLTDSNRIDEIKINNKIFKGTIVRKLLNIRSTDFSIKEEDDKILITTKGYGHGVGMSQYGANEMAKEGYDYKSILKHYYTGVDISQINV